METIHAASFGCVGAPYGNSTLAESVEDSSVCAGAGSFPSLNPHRRLPLMAQRCLHRMANRSLLLLNCIA